MAFAITITTKIILMKNKYVKLFALTLGLMTVTTTFAQEVSKPEAKKQTNSYAKALKKGLKFKLDKEGKSWNKTFVGVQLWYRNAEMNPGTKSSITGEDMSNHQDLSTRRIRLMNLTNIEDKFYMFADIGASSIGSNSNAASYGSVNNEMSMLIHDLWGKVRIAKNNYIGAGLHMWSGLSRSSMSGGITQLVLDFPISNFPNVNVKNQYNRQWGVFAQGRVLGGFDYSFAVNQVMMPKDSKFLYSDAEYLDKIVKETGKTLTDKAFNRRLAEGFSYKGYVSYSFFDKESLILPFKKGTYLGKKTILNIGAGFDITPNAAGIVNKGEKVVKVSNQQIFSADVFYEAPIGGGAITTYAAYYNSDFGKNYLKKVAVAGSFAKGSTSKNNINGPGIAEFNFGTGNMAYFQFGYLLPKSLVKGIQPFYAATYKDFDGLNEASIDHDFGMNWLVAGQNIKLTAQYSTRAIYNKAKEVDDTKGEFILQFQLRI